MLKMFLSAVATSQLSMTVLSLLPDLKQRFQTVQQRYATGHQSARGTTITIIGASILGFGMALCGSCPGTIYAQLGTGISTAYYVLAGSLAGSVVYANLQPALQALCRLNRSRAKTLDESLGARYMWPALALAFVELLVVFGLYVLFPNSTSLKDVLDLTSFTWPAYASGIGIGLLQIPSVLLLEQPLGASGNLNSVLAVLNRVPVLKRLIPSKSDLGKTMPLSKHNLLRWLAVVAAVGGAFASASLSRSYDAIAGLESGLVISRNPSRINAQAFVGGLALMVGARIAGGCTSGHGISGFSLLVMNSFAAVPSMFGSAVITAHILKLLSA